MVLCKERQSPLSSGLVQMARIEPSKFSTAGFKIRQNLFNWFQKREVPPQGSCPLQASEASLNDTPPTPTADLRAVLVVAAVIADGYERRNSDRVLCNFHRHKCTRASRADDLASPGGNEARAAGVIEPQSRGAVKERTHLIRLTHVDNQIS